MFASRLYQEGGLSGLVKANMAGPASPFIASPKCADALPCASARGRGSSQPGARMLTPLAAALAGRAPLAR